jgi:hypothetical protein
LGLIVSAKTILSIPERQCSNFHRRLPTDSAEEAKILTTRRHHMGFLARVIKKLLLCAFTVLLMANSDFIQNGMKCFFRALFKIPAE